MAFRRGRGRSLTIDVLDLAVLITRQKRTTIGMPFCIGHATRKATESGLLGRAGSPGTYTNVGASLRSPQICSLPDLGGPDVRRRSARVVPPAGLAVPSQPFGQGGSR